MHENDHQHRLRGLIWQFSWVLVNLYFLQGLSRKPSWRTEMSDLIVLIHSENNPRKFQKTWEDSTPKRKERRHQVGPAAPRVHMLAPRCYIGSPLPPRLHLRHLLKSVWSEGSRLTLRPIYISHCHPHHHQTLIKSFEKTETLIILRAPPYSRA